MTRQKKSRREGTLIQKPAKKDKNAVVANDKKPRKQLGNKPGSRQSVANKKSSNTAIQTNKDPRIGSKKPIDLTPVKSKVTEPKKAKVAGSIAPIYVEETVKILSLPEQLEAIENDPQLISILAKQDEGIELTEQEVNYFNDLMEDHERISQALEEEHAGDETDNKQADDSEDALWDKLDNSDFSDYS